MTMSPSKASEVAVSRPPGGREGGREGGRVRFCMDLASEFFASGLPTVRDEDEAEDGEGGGGQQATWREGGREGGREGDAS